MTYLLPARPPEIRFPAATPAANRLGLQDVIDRGQPVIRGGTYDIDAPLTVPSGGSVVAERSVKLRQVTQFRPVFDLLGRDDVTLRGPELVNASGPPPTPGGSVRGDSEYIYSAAVWSNGAGNRIEKLRAVDFAVGVYLNSSDGVTNIGNGVKRARNTVKGLDVSGCNHGVLFLNQVGLLIDGVRTRDHVDSSAGVNPMHGVYGTGDAANTSADVTIDNVLTDGCATGTALQVKYCTGLVFSNWEARACLGVANLQDVYDVRGAGVLSAGDLATGAGGAYSFLIGHVTAASARIGVDGVEIHKAVDSTGECSIICDDAELATFALHTLKNGLNTGAWDVRVHGNRVTLHRFKLRNRGTSSARAFLVGASVPTSDITIEGFETDGYRALVDVAAAVTGQNVFAYDPAAQRRTVFGAGSYIKELSGTPPYVVARRETTITYSVNGGTAWPLAGLETVSRFSVTTATAFTIALPQIGARAGMVHEIAVYNATTGALGAITWAAGYVFKAGAPAAPAAGATLNIRFMYDGTNWREM